jgi:hypothetical protein
MGAEGINFPARWERAQAQPTSCGRCLRLTVTSTQQCILSQRTYQHCYVFPKNLTTWWDSNTGNLFLRRMR